MPIAVKAASNTSLLVLEKEKPLAFKELANYMDGKLSLEETKNSKVYKKYDNSWVQKPTPAQIKENKEMKSKL